VLYSGNACADGLGRPLQPCDNRPPQTALLPVAVPLAIFMIPGADMFARCRKQPNGLVIYGCTFQASGDHPATVLINADQTPDERACTLAYEEAHLPPNSWYDPVMEAATPDVPSERALSTASSSHH